MGFLDIIKNLFKNNKKTAKLLTTDFDKIFGTSDAFKVILTDANDNVLPNQPITIEINGVVYTRTTNSEGVASLNINLQCGEYRAIIEFKNDEYNPVRSYANVVVSPKLNTQDMIMQEKDGSQFIAVVTSENGVRLEGIPVTFSVNGIDYVRKSHVDGEARLNINLGKGDYKITTSVYKSKVENNIHIDEKPKKVTRMEGVNITKAYSDKTAYQCAVYDDNGRVAGYVDITVNNTTYTKTPDETGLYKLNINLNPGTYSITAQYRGDDEHLGSQVINTIHVVEDPVKTVYNPIKIQYQPNSYTCGPTSLAMCSQVLGKSTSISAFSSACYTDGNGTSPSNLIAGARKLGFKVTAIGRSYSVVKNAIDAGKPVIAHVMTSRMKCLGWLGNYGHYVVIYDYDNGYYHVADPTKGISWCYKDQVDYATVGYEGIQYYSVELL